MLSHMDQAPGQNGRQNYAGILMCAGWLLLLACPGVGQTAPPASPQVPDAAGQPVAITLEEAIHRAQVNEPAYAAAMANSRVAALDRTMAKTALLPSVVYHNQYLYTEPNGESVPPGTQPTQKFIANNAVHEYASQGMVDEVIGVGAVAAVRHANASAAFASAQLEIARRGLAAAVTSLYFGVIAADQRMAIAEEAQKEAADFTGLTDKRERQREAAHADAVKAQLQQQQRERELSDARVAAERARLELGVLLFPDPRMAYTLAPDAPAALASREEVQQAAAKNNPELRSALASLEQSNADVLAARGAYLPSLGLNYTYGIDAPQFAVNGPDGSRNLGYSASATLDIPIWDWLATQHKVKQSEIRRDVAKVELSATQRRLIARLDEAYSEAAAARDQLASLDASVTTAGESLRLTKLRYTGGEATVLEVVDAQTALVTAGNARADGLVRYRAALADLQTLTGTM
ncbi:MAG TPA: TolC family protein [Terracidiphilus sp.]|nr:TolC family protein [Terracidiphilus sp.]